MDVDYRQRLQLVVSRILIDTSPPPSPGPGLPEQRRNQPERRQHRRMVQRSRGAGADLEGGALHRPETLHFLMPSNAHSSGWLVGKHSMPLARTLRNFASNNAVCTCWALVPMLR